jgi:hypothetical protein
LPSPHIIVVATGTALAQGEVVARLGRLRGGQREAREARSHVDDLRGASRLAVEGISRYSAPLSRLGQIRSAGVTDLLSETGNPLAIEMHSSSTRRSRWLFRPITNRSSSGSATSICSTERRCTKCSGSWLSTGR